MRNRLIIDGNAVYEIDDECVKRKQGRNSGAGEMEKIRWPHRDRIRIGGGDDPPSRPAEGFYG